MCAEGSIVRRRRGPIRTPSSRASGCMLMSSVRVLADEIHRGYEHIDVLANNAGALFASRKETSEGFEQTLALNHLAPFLLTNLLRDRLAGGRVVTTASDAHKSGRLDLDDLQSEKSYSPRVYGGSKLCNVLFTRELARRAPESHANSLPPRRRAHRLCQERNRDLEGRRHARRALLSLPGARRPLAGLARAVRRRRSSHRCIHRGREGGRPQRLGPGPGRQPCGEPLGTKRRARRPARRCGRLTRSSLDATGRRSPACPRPIDHSV